jgi:hypothetical protein
MRPFTAGATYFIIVFAAAFILGALRVSFVVPVVGALWATLAELPFTLAASWVTCAWIVRRWFIASIRQSILMSFTAFVLLMSAEAIGSSLIFGVTLRDLIRSYGTAAGALGLAGQIAFGLFPVVQSLRGNAVKAR